MLIEILENARTLRGLGAKRKYRYTRRVKLRCEICLNERVVNYSKKIRESDIHPCKTCKNRSIGKANKGRPAWNKGNVKPRHRIEIGKAYINSSGYKEVYLGRGHNYTSRKDKYCLIHRLVAELQKGSPLTKHERVHHIDGDKLNNQPNNLYICQSNGHHREIHDQLESISMQLVQAGIIQFDILTEKYTMPHLEEILNAYSVNSGETYSLSVDKAENMAILSQADSPSEGATTIPLGSRV